MPDPLRLAPWPAIIAIAFGVEGVSSVAKILSKIVKRLAKFQNSGMVSQSMCAITRRANCVPSAWLILFPALAYFRYSSAENPSIRGTPSTTCNFAASPS